MGGTIDCVAHEILKDGMVGELFRATGGEWGGTIVDRGFLQLLNKIFGSTFIEKFKTEYPKDYVELLQDFEIKKREGPEITRVALPYNFNNLSHEGVSVQQMIEAYGDENKEVTFKDGKLELKSTVVDSLFSDVLSKINNHVQKLTENTVLVDLNYIFIVGGFAESSRLQKSLKDHFGDKVTCLIPDESSLAIVRGAVDFGHDPTLIKQRICKYTYGVGYCDGFKPDIHREDLKFRSEGQDYCDKVFETWAKEGDIIGYNDVWFGTYYPLKSKQESMVFEFFRSTKRHVMYTDEKDMEDCGSLNIKMPNLAGGKTRPVELEVIFGGTELKVVGYDKTTSTKTEAKIDFFLRSSSQPATQKGNLGAALYD